MHPLTRLWRADESRRTRFHTANGRLCLNPSDIAFALATTLLRHATGRLVRMPWIALPAYRYLRARVRGGTVFEFGSGMSTVWFGRRCEEVHSVEHDRTWCKRVRQATARYPRVDVRLCERREEYVGRIDDFPEGYFDVILIDGVHRAECHARSLSRLRAGGLLVVDNTDTAQTRPILERLPADFADGQVLRFAGFPPGNLHPVETTICVRPAS